MLLPLSSETSKQCTFVVLLIAWSWDNGCVNCIVFDDNGLKRVHLYDSKVIDFVIFLTYVFYILDIIKSIVSIQTSYYKKTRYKRISKKSTKKYDTRESKKKVQKYSIKFKIYKNID